MGKVGGYQILNLGNYPFVENSRVVIPGVFKTLTSNNKIILLQGFSFKGKEYHSEFVDPTVTSDKITISIGSNLPDIKITSDDMVEVS